MTTRYVEDLAGLQACYRDVQASTHVAYDLETTGLEPLDGSILLLQFCGASGDCWVVNTNQHSYDHIRAILLLLADGQRVTLAHNAAFEYLWTLEHFNLRLARLYDTMLAEEVLTAGLVHLQTNLEDTALRRLNVQLDKTLQKSFIGADPATFSPTPEQIAYAAGDVHLLHDLRRVQVAALKAEGLVQVAALEFAALPVFAEMQRQGMALDLDQHATVLKKYTADAEHYGIIAAGVLDEYYQAAAQRQYEASKAKYDELQQQIEALLPGGRAKKDTPEAVKDATKALRKERDKAKPKPLDAINLNSNQQVLAALAEAGISLPDLKAETVEEHKRKSPVLLTYARYCKAHKVTSTYGESLRERVRQDTGRLHFSYRQIVQTGRTSSDGAQVMPKDIRACFKPAAGRKFVVADFANMELRIAAGMFQDPVMMAAFANGEDLHCMTAAAAWPERYATWHDVPKDGEDRKVSKIANFLSIYGGSAEAAYYRGLIDDLDVAKKVVAGIEAAYPVLWQGIHEAGEQAVHTGYALTALGRKRYFTKLAPCPRGWSEQRDWKKQRSRIVRQAMNHPVQGTGADIAKRAMILIHEQLQATGWGAVVGMVHDEIITEADAEHAEAVAKIVGAAMVQAGAGLIKGVDIPADVHIVDAWIK